MSKVYFDSETCGLHSMPVLFQYAEEDGPICLYDVWKRPIRETLRLIEWLCENTVVGFNLAFDWFMVVKTYTTFRLAEQIDARVFVPNQLGDRGQHPRHASQPAHPPPERGVAQLPQVLLAVVGRADDPLPAHPDGPAIGNAAAWRQSPGATEDQRGGIALVGYGKGRIIGERPPASSALKARHIPRDQMYLRPHQGPKGPPPAPMSGKGWGNCSMGSPFAGMPGCPGTRLGCRS